MKSETILTTQNTHELIRQDYFFGDKDSKSFEEVRECRTNETVGCALAKT